MTTWNHLIQPCRNMCVPSGRPAVMYQMPGLYVTRDYLCGVQTEEVEMCMDE